MSVVRRGLTVRKAKYSEIFQYWSSSGRCFKKEKVEIVEIGEAFLLCLSAFLLHIVVNESVDLKYYLYHMTFVCILSSHDTC